MNLQHLRYAVEIANFGSISRAASALYVSQPYLSKIIRELEEEYGITIFARSKNGIIPTDSGHLFLDMARDLLDNAKNFESVFQERKEDYRLRISSSTNSHFIDALIRMVNSVPSDFPLRFSYRETSNQNVLDDVYNSRCDIGTIILNHSNYQEFSELIHLKRMSAVSLFTSSPWLIAREGHPILARKDELTIEDIYSYNFVLYPSNPEKKTRALESIYNDSFLKLINWNKIRQIIYVQTRAALHNILLMTDYLGIGIFPILEQEKNYHLASIPFPVKSWVQDNPQMNHTLYCVYRKDQELPKAAQTYISCLKKYYGEGSGFPGTNQT
ncbi:MAG: LysR family transcriptional regulator [Clostridium sp.]|nr:LysR family transcriptional regulator [Clostridium sp.]